VYDRMKNVFHIATAVSPLLVLSGSRFHNVTLRRDRLIAVCCQITFHTPSNISKANLVYGNERPPLLAAAERELWRALFRINTGSNAMKELSAFLIRFQDLQVDYAEENAQLDWFSPTRQYIYELFRRVQTDTILGMVSPIAAVTANAERLSLQDSQVGDKVADEVISASQPGTAAVTPRQLKTTKDISTPATSHSIPDDSAACSISPPPSPTQSSESSGSDKDEDQPNEDQPTASSSKLSPPYIDCGSPSEPAGPSATQQAPPSTHTSPSSPSSTPSGPWHRRVSKSEALQKASQSVDGRTGSAPSSRSSSSERSSSSSSSRTYSPRKTRSASKAQEAAERAEGESDDGESSPLSELDEGEGEGEGEGNKGSDGETAIGGDSRAVRKGKNSVDMKGKGSVKVKRKTKAVAKVPKMAIVSKTEPELAAVVQTLTGVVSQNENTLYIYI
jgi:hypothetical protein